MNDILQMLGNPVFWVGTVIAGILVNITSNYFQKGIDRFWSRYSAGRRQRLEKIEKARQEKIQIMASLYGASGLSDMTILVKLDIILEFVFSISQILISMFIFVFAVPNPDVLGRWLGVFLATVLVFGTTRRRARNTDEIFEALKLAQEIRRTTLSNPQENISNQPVAQEMILSNSNPENHHS